MRPRPMALSATPRRLALLRGGPSEAAGDPPGCTVRGPGRGASAARGRSGPRSSCGGNESVSSGTDGPGGQAPPRPARPFSLQWAAPPQPSAAAPGGPGPAAGRASQGHHHAVWLHGQALRLCGLLHEPLNPDTKVTKKHCSSCCPSVQNPPCGSSSPCSPVCLCSATPAHTVTALLIPLQFVQPNCPLRLCSIRPLALAPEATRDAGSATSPGPQHGRQRVSTVTRHASLPGLTQPGCTEHRTLQSLALLIRAKASLLFSCQFVKA